MINENDMIGINIPKSEKYLSIARLAASGIASKMDFPLDEIEDIKTALTEICNTTLNSSNKNNNLAINFEVKDNKLDITVEDKDMQVAKDKFENQNALGMSFIESLMDELDYICSNEIGTKIKISKYNGNKF